MLFLVLLPNWDWCPPRLYLCVRRRFGPDVDGWSGFDMVGSVGRVFCVVGDVVGCWGCDML
jgi:hypothetical protein